MSTEKQSKIKKMLQSVPNGTVCLAIWLESIGISRDLQKRYKKSDWLAPIGTGAFIRPGDKPQWQGGVYAIQKQARLNIHPGGLTALTFQGFAHYLRLGSDTVYLFAKPKSILPKWFKNHDWGKPVEFYRSAFLPEGLGLVEHKEATFNIEISTPERAILECLYLAPEKMDLVECYQIMEGLVNLRPQLLQELLENCTSIKVVRLFLYMAEKANHAWLKYLDKTKFNIGTGDRSIVKKGVYLASHKITLPKDLVDL
jgi:hypothetical protein